MGNILERLKHFLKNKNTVTILVVFAGIFMLYMVYNWRVQKATEQIKIPYAKNTLASRHLITSEDIGYIEVSGSVVAKMKNVIRTSGALIGKEITYGNAVQQNSFFFKSDVTDSKTNKKNSSILSNLESGYTPVYVEVDLHTTYGNAIYPGNYIDLWFEGTNENYDKIYGKFITSIKVLDVIDRDVKSVFETSAEARKPKELVFAVPNEMYPILYNAGKIGKLVPVPRNKSYSKNPEETKIASEYLQDFILSKSASIPDTESSVSNVIGGDTNE
jgi:Flp pilus assembly protein CpaB